MMTTLIHRQSGLDPPKTVSTSSRYVFWGAVIGTVVALATVFAGSTFFAAASGIETVNCAVFGCFVTVLLSQPAAVIGIAAGAAVGGVCALVVRFVHKSRRHG